MDNETNKLRQFGEFRLDSEKRVLWHRGEPVDLALKEIELLLVLTENSGQVVTKAELLDRVWRDSFVEESNLSRHVYVLRKAFKDLGENADLIQTVPRRGYRFTAEAREIDAEDIVLEKHTRTRTLIEFQEKNGSQRARLLAYASLVVILAGASAFFASRYLGSPPTAPGINSMAVLPFKTLGTEPHPPHAGAGLADILITRLSNIKDVKIRPASAVAGLENEDAVGAGRRLQVDGVLEGSIYYSGERVRVTARLVRVADASVVWSGEFEKLKRDEMQMQNELALQIVPILTLNLSSGEHDAIVKRYTENPTAYDLYLRGRYEWNKRNTTGVLEAQRLFRNAIESDPAFALAYVGLADSLNLDQSRSNESPYLIATALELDPTLAEAHASLGFYQMFYEWEWRRAEESFRTSISLNQNYATAHHWYATLLSIKGETRAATAEMHRALDLNPVSYNFLADLGQLYYFAGEYSEAETYCRKALEVYPDFAFAHEYLYYIYMKTGEHEKALNEIARAESINGAMIHGPSSGIDQAQSYIDVYRRSGIEGYLDYKYPGKPHDPSAFYPYAIKYALSGENEKALDYLERSADARMFLAVFVKANPAFDGLRSEARYHEILRKMGLA